MMMMMMMMLLMMVMILMMMMMVMVNKGRLTGEHLASSHFAQLGQWRLHQPNPSYFMLLVFPLFCAIRSMVGLWGNKKVLHFNFFFF